VVMVAVHRTVLRRFAVAVRFAIAVRLAIGRMFAIQRAIWSGTSHGRFLAFVVSLGA
jgi:hypothetical protein